MQNVVVNLGDEELEREEKQEIQIDPRSLAQPILAGAWSTETGVSGGQSPRKRCAEKGCGHRHCGRNLSATSVAIGDVQMSKVFRRASAHPTAQFKRGMGNWFSQI